MTGGEAWQPHAQVQANGNVFELKQSREHETTDSPAALHAEHHSITNGRRDPTVLKPTTSPLTHEGAQTP